MSFSKYCQDVKNKIEGYLTELAESFAEIAEPLSIAMKYSIQSGGKRFRPMFFYEAFKLFSDREFSDREKNFLLAIECIHLYSLVHDDLPCMDDDDFRRGKPAVHKVFGEGIAVLTGDALLNLAYELMLKSIVLSKDDMFLFAKAAKIIADACGAKGLVGGQNLDLTLGKDAMTPNKLDYIFRHKTGDLITAAAVSGAIIGGADDDEIDAVREYAQNYGYAFQIKDDILDYGDYKPDSKEPNFVAIYGMNSTKKTLINSTDKAIQALGRIKGKDLTFFTKIALKSVERKE